MLPNEPYTPVLNALSLDYTAAAELVPGDRHAAGAFLIVGPFGATPASDRAAARVVPADRRRGGVVPRHRPACSRPANLSLFFQIDVGTASSAEVLKPGDTEWSYLAAGDSWRAVELVGGARRQHRGLPEARADRDRRAARRFARASQPAVRPGVAARAHPASAGERGANPGREDSRRRWRDSSPAACRSRTSSSTCVSGLPAGTITRLVQPNANISRVEQPNPSFGGRGNGSAAPNTSGAAASACAIVTAR